MTFEEYKILWMQHPEHQNDTDEVIRGWYDNATTLYWCSDIKTKQLCSVTSGRKANSFTYEEAVQNKIIYNTIRKFKQEQIKFEKLKEDFQ